jgi:hypothetical protein
MQLCLQDYTEAIPLSTANLANAQKSVRKPKVPERFF